MKKNISRLERLEEILSPKAKKVIILDYISDEPDSWIEVNRTKYLIPPEADLEKFIREKIKLIRGIRICTLQLSKDRLKKPETDFSNLISKEDMVVKINRFSRD